MNLLKLFGLSRSELPTPEQIRATRERLAQFDLEIEERHRQRIPTREQLTKAIDL